MKNSSQLQKFTEACMRLATQQVPLFSCKFSKHTFTQPQLVVLYCLKIKLGVTYREREDWLREMPRIRETLGLKQLPHCTTVQKAFQRWSPWRVRQRRGAALSVGDGVAARDASTARECFIFLTGQAQAAGAYRAGGYPSTDSP